MIYVLYHIYDIYDIYDYIYIIIYLCIFICGSRSKGPCKGFKLRPLGFQHETRRKFFSEFAKEHFYVGKEMATVYLDEVAEAP